METMMMTEATPGAGSQPDNRAEAGGSADGEKPPSSSSLVFQLVHELRNHLGPIQNTLAMIRVSGADQSTMAWALGVLDRQTDQMKRLVDDMLDLAQSGDGRLSIQPETFDLCTLVIGVIESLKSSLEPSRHRLVVDVPPLPLTLHADPVRIRQVLFNLINNAVKYTDPGGSITLHASNHADEVVFSVRDDGIGIAPEALPHVFDLFWQSNDSVHRSQGGHGIGLSVVRHIVELHGGSVSAASAGRGKGSDFQVRLPKGVATRGPDEGPA
jgi:signal transduction histidine kinase